MMYDDNDSDVTAFTTEAEAMEYVEKMNVALSEKA